MHCGDGSSMGELCRRPDGPWRSHWHGLGSQWDRPDGEGWRRCGEARRMGAEAADQSPHSLAPSI